MSIANLPAARINCGQPFAMSIQFSEGSAPVDLSGWSARFAVATDYTEEAIVDAAPLLGGEGAIAVTLSSAQTFLLQPFAGRALVFQLDLEGDGQAHRMQGRVLISPEVLE
jgi:hypothetical protein